MEPAVALLPSVFLGPAAWRPVADRLNGRSVRVVLPPEPPTGLGTPEDVLGWLADVLPHGEPLVLVPHSNAGLYVPRLAARRRVAAFVFADAILPPSTGRIPVAPPDLVAALRDKVAPDGLLPRWTDWWETDLADLFPDPEVRWRVEAGQPRLPYDYLTATVDIPAGWDGAPGTYVSFGDTYASEAADAAARGWRVSRLPGRHLHMLHDPEAVAAEIAAATEAVTN